MGLARVGHGVLSAGPGINWPKCHVAAIPVIDGISEGSLSVNCGSRGQWEYPGIPEMKSVKLGRDARHKVLLGVRIGVIGGTI